MGLPLFCQQRCSLMAPCSCAVAPWAMAPCALWREGFSKRAVVQPKRSFPGNGAFWRGDTLPRDPSNLNGFFKSEGWCSSVLSEAESSSRKECEAEQTRRSSTGDRHGAASRLLRRWGGVGAGGAPVLPTVKMSRGAHLWNCRPRSGGAPVADLKYGAGVRRDS